MGTERGRLLLLAALVIVLGGLAYRALVTGWGTPGTSAALAPASNPPGARGAGSISTQARNRGAGDVTAPEVHLGVLNGERPKPGEAERNLFRFKPKLSPAPPQARETPPVTAPPAPPRPTGPPPIALKFIGTVQKDNGRTTYAVLTDGDGPPMSGREGDTIAGRYRILRIGVESIEMSYLDGRGRQTIRLTGS